MLRHALILTRGLTHHVIKVTKQKQTLYQSPFNYLIFSQTYFWRKIMGDTQSQFSQAQASNQNQGLTDTTKINRPGKIKLSDDEWQAKLTKQEFSVCRKHGTEQAWTGDLLDNKAKGIYTCACCGTEIFNSSTKFDSGSGWPSFYDVLKDKDVPDLPAVDIRKDGSLGMIRSEVLCGKCDAHLGHVFDDGPRPTGLRYCINSVCLKFKADPKGEDKKKSEL